MAQNFWKPVKLDSANASKPETKVATKLQIDDVKFILIAENPYGIDIYKEFSEEEADNLIKNMFSQGLHKVIRFIEIGKTDKKFESYQEFKDWKTK